MAANNRQNRTRERTAYHEAGHAVIAHRCGVRFAYVTIVPGEDSLGHLLHHKWSRGFAPAVTVTPLMRERLESRILSALAGGLAEKKWSGRYNAQGSKADHAAVINMADFIGGEGRVLEKYLAWLWARAEAMIETWWPDIVAVAAALLEHPRGRLTHDEVRTMFLKRVGLDSILDGAAEKRGV